MFFLKQEDSGDIYSTGEDVQAPDYRIILKSGQQLFVEVKNFYPADPLSKYKIKAEYLNRLKAYSSLFGIELKLAVYWTKWNIWTLSALTCLEQDASNYFLNFTDAILKNEMGLLGDMSIGLVPPLIFQVMTDPSKPRTIGDDGQVEFTIKKINVVAGGIILEDEDDQNLALSLMLFGDWPEDSRGVVERDQLVSIDFVSEPLERTEDQLFEIIGTLSGIVSRQFNSLTAPEGETQTLVPREEPGEFRIELPPSVPHSAYGGTGIPPTRKGKQLEIWCFHQVVC